MPAQWTANLIGKMHLNGIKRKDLAAQLGLHEKYVIMVLNGKKEPPNAEERFADWMEKFCARKWNSDFSIEMSRSAREIIKYFCKK